MGIFVCFHQKLFYTGLLKYFIYSGNSGTSNCGIRSYIKRIYFRNSCEIILRDFVTIKVERYSVLIFFFLFCILSYLLFFFFFFFFFFFIYLFIYFIFL